MEVISDVREFESDYGKAYAIDVLYDGMTKNLVMSKSFRFQLKVAMERAGIKETADLIGHKIVFQKAIGNTKQYKNVELYSVQLK